MSDPGEEFKRLETSGQVPLLAEVFRESDRNFEKGGRSFYFFDFDDNVIHLPTKIFLFHKTVPGKEHAVSTTEYSKIHHDIGTPGTAWADYEIRVDNPYTGSFRAFRDHPPHLLKGEPQYLIADMIEALSHPFLDWRGPSWEFFVHAVNNNRPVSIITARGNHAHTIRRAINILRNSRDLAACPNYVSVYACSNPETRLALGDTNNEWSTARLKKAAIQAAVRDAFACYGENPHHRFGMSDDDPANVRLIIEAMKELKAEFPRNAFFVINTHGRRLIKEEVLLEGTASTDLNIPQTELFKK